MLNPDARLKAHTDLTQPAMAHKGQWDQVCAEPIPTRHNAHRGRSLNNRDQPVSRGVGAVAIISCSFSAAA